VIGLLATPDVTSTRTSESQPVNLKGGIIVRRAHEKKVLRGPVATDSTKVREKAEGDWDDACHIVEVTKVESRERVRRACLRGWWPLSESL
jgi:hypothetical protein